jgi:hypothetical protein
MGKPSGMNTRQYVNHMTHINQMELPYLLPFRGDAGRFTDNEFKEIILFGIPNSWKKEMDKLDFYPFTKLIREVVEFCERMEASVTRQVATIRERKIRTKFPRKRSSSTRTRPRAVTAISGATTTKPILTPIRTLKKLKASKSGTSGNSSPAKKQWKSKSE